MNPTDEACPRLPLRGLRVVEFGDFLAVPYCARLLADAGAEVVKIEPPTGDSARRVGPFPEDRPGPTYSAMFSYVNRGKKGVILDARVAKERRILLDLIERADVFVHDFPSLLESDLRVALEDLKQLHPALVITSVTPFGEQGPYSRYKADDLVLAAMGGLASATPGFPDHAADLESESPLRPGAYIAELVGGVVGATGTILALLGRQLSGLGDRVEVSKQEALASMMVWNLGVYAYGGDLVGRRQMRARQAPNHYLPCADGWVALVAFLDKHWRKLVPMMGNPAWAQSPRFATGADRGLNWETLELLLLPWLLHQPRRRFFQRARREGIPSAAALTLPEALSNEQVRARRFLVPSGLPNEYRGKLPGIVWVIDGRRPIVTARAPAPGQHTRQVLKKWCEKSRPSLHTVEAIHQGHRSNLPPLAGIRVIDLGQMIAVPLAGQWLAQLGAEVILIESRVHMPSRSLGPFAGEPAYNTSAVFNAVNRRKLSCTLNLSVPAGLDLVKRLVASADVVMENFVPGTMDRLGLGYEAVRRIKPDIIYLSVSAFGGTGPWRTVPALHSGIILASGLAAVTGYPGGHPRMPGGVLPDPIAAHYSVLAVCEAIYHRCRTGKGQHIDLAMSEAVQSLMPDSIAACTLAGRVPERIGNRHPSKAPHGIYRCAGDDTWVAISAGTDQEWAALCRCMGRSDLLVDSRFATTANRQAHADFLDAAVSAWARTLDRWAATRLLQRVGVPAGPVFTEHDIVHDEHLLSRHFIVEDEHPHAGRHAAPGMPWRFQHVLPEASRPAPLLGANNAYVFGEILGLSQDVIRYLTQNGVIH